MYPFPLYKEVLGLEFPTDEGVENVSEAEKPRVLQSQRSLDSTGAQ